MSDAMNSHATAIKQAARDLAQGNIWATDRHIETIDHHLRALVAERDEARRDRDAREEAFDMCARSVLPYQEYIEELESKRAEANARAARLADAVRHHCEHRALDIARRQNLTGPEINQLATDLASGAGLHDGDLDAAPGDPAGER